MHDSFVVVISNVDLYLLLLQVGVTGKPDTTMERVAFYNINKPNTIIRASLKQDV